MKAPHEAKAPRLRHGGFWIPGDLLSTPRGTFQRGPMWVEWLAPVENPTNAPLILVHGGGGQGTDWLVTPDGRPGWAQRLAAAGRAVYVVDRPGHGRSPHHPAVLGEPNDQMAIEDTIGVFAHPDAAQLHRQWPWSREADGPEITQLAASSGFLLANLAESQRLDGERLVALLARTGPAILVTHSAGAPAGWIAASESPRVAGIVAIEPMGPAYVDVPGLGALTEGITASPLGPRGLSGIAAEVVSAGTSPFAAAAASVVEFLTDRGARARAVPPDKLGLEGNGHGLMFEANSDSSASAVLALIGAFE